MKIRSLLALAIAAPSLALAQNPPAGAPNAAQPPTTTTTIPAKWDVSAKHGTQSDVEFDTNVGTWMAVDLSPDGSTIAFDILGDIYTMPASGGQAKLILTGPAYESQPRFSPDGKRIAFSSDRDGLMNVWTMDVNGHDLRQVSKEREREVSNPYWTPDGQYLVARKHFRNTRSLGAGEMWLYHTAGGNGVKLTDRRNWEQNATEPSVSPDGRYVYFSEDVSPGGGFQYNRDPHGVIYVVQRLDRQTGRRTTLIGGNGGSIAPAPSPDGKSIAFIRRVGNKSVLMLHDIESGAERAIYDKLDHDQQEAWAIYGTYPGYAWAKDGKRIVIWAGGKIQNIDVASGAATPIPFTAHVKQTITDAVRFPQQVAPDSFDVKMTRWVQTSPDGKRVVYAALTHLWVKDLPNGQPRRVTNDNVNLELFPSWSADGQSIIYSTWNDDSLGAVRMVGIDGRNMRKLTTKPGHYISPRLSADGRQAVYQKIGGDGLRTSLYSGDQGIYIVPTAGGEPRLVTEEGSDPRFNRDGDRLFLTSRDNGRNALVSVNLNGAERRVHVIADNATAFAPSPDEHYVAWLERFNAYVAPMPLTGKGVDVNGSTGDFPVRKISRDAGLYLHWSPDSKRVYWALGPELFERDINRTFAFEASDTTQLLREPESKGIPIGFKAPFDRPTGKLALVGATIISMKGNEVIQNGTIVIDRNRITAVGPSGSVSIPSDATKIDVKGKYIMPGFVDAHAHIFTGSSGITPRTSWTLLTSLAFGTTTMHDPSNDSEMIFSSSESVKAGEIISPRLFSTGTILYGAEAPFKAITTSFDDALGHLRRMQALGAFSVKSYNQPRRDARQQIIEAARQLGMEVVPEGGSTFANNISMILDGHTTVEHNLPIAPLYEDVQRLFAASKTANTPTLIVNYNGLSGENWWYQHDSVWANQRLRNFSPVDQLDARSRRVPMAADDDYTFIETSKSAKALNDRGVLINLGAHGQLTGLGAHWELWMLQMGGMTNHEALRAATLNGAKSLGLDKDVGSLETGKLADLLVLDANPLQNIRNSTSIRYVMINGRMFDANTMAQLGNHATPAPKPVWRDAGGTSLTHSDGDGRP